MANRDITFIFPHGGIAINPRCYDSTHWSWVNRSGETLVPYRLKPATWTDVDQLLWHHMADSETKGGFIGCNQKGNNISITMTPWCVRWRLKLAASRLFTQPIDQAQIKENIKAPRHQRRLVTGGSNAEHVSFDDVIMRSNMKTNGYRR